MKKKWLICLFAAIGIFTIIAGCQNSMIHADTKQTNKVTKKDSSNLLEIEKTTDAKEYLQLKIEVYKELKSNTSTQTPHLLDIPLINQMSAPKLYNGCEVTSLAMILNYNDIKVTKNELAKQIPKVPFKYKNGLNGNPNIGFIGNMEVGPGLTVYHGPITDLAIKYAGNRVQDLTGQDISAIYQKIDKGIPVWVITTTTFAPVDNFQLWNTSEGKIKITKNVHSVVVTGYDNNHVFINNPFGIKNQKIDRTNFEKAWVQMGRQAVIITMPTTNSNYRAS